MQNVDPGTAANPATGAPALDSFFAADDKSVDVARLAATLDGLADAERAAFTMKMTPRQQARLYEAAAGFRPLSLEHFVPRGVAPLEQVDHAGKNSIPIFSRFEKRFCLPVAGSDRLWGYNFNPASIRPVTGPGYFVCYAIENGEVLIDYTQVPEGAPPAGWPAVRPNSAGLSRFIYHRTKDTMRGVSRHVSIGRAARDGKPLDNWFVLCRLARTPERLERSEGSG